MELLQENFNVVILMLLLSGCNQKKTQLIPNDTVCTIKYTKDIQFAKEPEVIFQIIYTKDNTIDIVLSDSVEITEAAKLFFECYEKMYGNVIRKASR